MISKLYTFSGRHTTALSLTHGGLRILTALALALTLMGVNPSEYVQASPVGDEGDTFEFRMTAVPSATFVCVGQPLDIKVTISRFLVSQPGDTGPAFGIIQGVSPDVKPVDQSVGTIAISATIQNSTNNHPETTIYTFKASQNPGKTTINFFANIPIWWDGTRKYISETSQYHAERDLEIDVRKCTYKVNMVQKLSWQGLSITGVADQTLLRTDSDTHFSGGANHKTLAQFMVPDAVCPFLGGHTTGGISMKIENTTAEYTIDVAGDRLYFTSTLAPYSVTTTDLCSGKSISFPMGGSNPQPYILPVGGGVIVKRSIIASTTFTVERVAIP